MANSKKAQERFVATGKGLTVEFPKKKGTTKSANKRKAK